MGSYQMSNRGLLKKEQGRNITKTGFFGKGVLFMIMVSNFGGKGRKK